MIFDGDTGARWVAVVGVGGATVGSDELAADQLGQGGVPVEQDPSVLGHAGLRSVVWWAVATVGTVGAADRSDPN